MVLVWRNASTGQDQIKSVALRPGAETEPLFLVLELSARSICMWVELVSRQPVHVVVALHDDALLGLSRSDGFGDLVQCLLANGVILWIWIYMNLSLVSIQRC